MFMFGFVSDENDNSLTCSIACFIYIHLPLFLTVRIMNVKKSSGQD